MISGFGDSAKAAMEDFHECHFEVKELWAKDGKELPELEFTFLNLDHSATSFTISIFNPNAVIML